MRGRCLSTTWAVLCCAVLGGCSFGPRTLEQTHGQYNEAVKRVTEEELLLNIVRLRYNDNPARLDVSSIAAQYELSTSAEARPFFLAPNPNGATFRTFANVLPDLSLTGVNRPTISLTPADDPDTIRSLFTPSTPDGIIFLAETSYPIATVFRLWVEYLNQIPNAVSASGPPRERVPEYRRFQRAVELLQCLQDSGAIRFVREERFKEVGDALPAGSVTAAAQVDAARSGFEYHQRPDQTWTLVKRSARLALRVNPTAASGSEMVELCQLLNLKSGRLSYEINVGGSGEPFPLECPPEESVTLNLNPRSAVQAFYYLAHGVVVPPEHFECGAVKPTLEPDGGVFDWQQVTAGLFTVHSIKQHSPPKNAYVAVKYRDHWFYLDDRDGASKITFSLMLTMTRVNLLGVRKSGAPSLTLPVGR